MTYVVAILVRLNTPNYPVDDIALNVQEIWPTIWLN